MRPKGMTFYHYFLMGKGLRKTDYRSLTNHSLAIGCLLVLGSILRGKEANSNSKRPKINIRSISLIDIKTTLFDCTNRIHTLQEHISRLHLSRGLASEWKPSQEMYLAAMASHLHSEIVLRKRLRSIQRS